MDEESGSPISIKLRRILQSLTSAQGKNLLKGLLVLTSLLTVPLTVYAIKNTSIFDRVSASAERHFEAESSLTYGSVSALNDSNASGGQYVFLQKITTVASDFQPTAPYYATFYYPWYLNPNTDSSWSYWTDHGNSPPNTWFSHFIPDPNPGAFDPASELYSSNNYNIFKWQVAKMAEAKIEVSIGSWFGQGTKQDIAMDKILNDFMGRADNPYPNLRWAIYYEDEGNNDPSVSQIVSDLTHISTKFANSNYFLKINGKPVIFVYAGGNDIPGTMTQRWKDASAQTGNKFYIVLKVFSGFANDPNQPDSWHQYAPAVRGETHGSHSSFVSPGFWLDDGVSPVRLARNAGEFEQFVKTMVSANTTWKLIETWNEWGEGSSVEPGNQVILSNGKKVIDPNGAPFGNLYIDILGRNLPALEKGVGTNQTPPPAPSPTLTPSPISQPNTVTVVAVGDIACGPESSGASCKEKATSDAALAQSPDAVVVLGDNQYEQGELNYFLGSPAFCNSNPVRCYGPTWGRMKSITHPAVGNHEYLTPSASGYFDYFNGTNAQTGPAGDRSTGYYAYDLGAWRVYALNSNCSQVSCSAGSAQEKWLRNDLSSNPRRCVLAYYHHPLHTSGSRSTAAIAPLFKTLYDFGADVVLAGHEHNYERFAPQDVNGNPDPSGIQEFVVGTGGRNFTQFTQVAANSVARNDNTFGVLKLTLKDTSYDFQFIGVSGSSYTDQGSVNCH